MGFLGAILPVIGSVAGRVANSLFPDPAEALKRQEVIQKFQAELISEAQALEKAAADIVKAEAQSTYWLAANWRPLTMLIFVALIVARWFGWAAPNLAEAEYIKLWDIVEIGLGGYVIGRSAEKIMPMVAEAIKGGKK